jgi:hypothetical protein
MIGFADPGLSLRSRLRPGMALEKKAAGLR